MYKKLDIINDHYYYILYFYTYVEVVLSNLSTLWKKQAFEEGLNQ